MEIVADDPEQRHLGGPRPAVALGDQLAANAQPQPRHVGVGEEAVDAAARVVADLEHRVDAVLRRSYTFHVSRRAPGGSDSGDTFTVFPP